MSYILQDITMKLAAKGEEWARSKQAIVDSQLAEKRIAHEFRQLEDDFRSAKQDLMKV